MSIEGLLFSIGLGFAFLGQYYFAHRREFVWDGVFFWVVAVLAFALLLRRASRRRQRFRPWAMGVRDWLRWVSGVVGGGLALAAGWEARQRPDGADFSGPLLWWLAGVYFFLVAFLPESPVGEWWAGVRRRFYRQRWEMAWLAVLLLFALAVRGYDLEHIPANLGGDEGTQGMAALELLGPPPGNPFATGWYSVPTMSFLAYGLTMRVFGETVAGLRMLSALVGTLTVLTVFLLAREVWGKRVAWMAAVLLATAHYHLHFSRLGSNQVADGLFVTLAGWLLIRAIRRRRMYLFALAGAVVGLGWYGYFGARLVSLLTVVYLGWRSVVGYRFGRRFRRQMAALVLAVLVVAGPLLLYYAAHPDELWSRPRQVGIFPSGWLEREVEVTGKGATVLLLQQFWKSVSAFNYTLDPTFWYHPEIPLLDWVSGALFVIGLVWSLAHLRRPNHFWLPLWFWSAVVTGWVLTENPPSSQRMVIVAPALAIFVALGLDWMDGWVRRLWPEVGGRLVPVALVVIAFLNLPYYFEVFTPKRVYGNPTAEIGTVLSRYLAQKGDDEVVYFYGAPFMYWGHGTVRFMARDVTGFDVLPEGEGQAPPPDGYLERGVRFVFLPERLDEMEAVQKRYPDGVEEEVYSDADGRLLFVVYEVVESSSGGY